MVMYTVKAALRSLHHNSNYIIFHTAVTLNMSIDISVPIKGDNRQPLAIRRNTASPEHNRIHYRRQQFLVYSKN